MAISDVSAHRSVFSAFSRATLNSVFDQNQIANIVYALIANASILWYNIGCIEPKTTGECRVHESRRRMVLVGRCSSGLSYSFKRVVVVSKIYRDYRKCREYREGREYREFREYRVSRLSNSVIIAVKSVSERII